MGNDIIGYVAIAMSFIGFITVWIKLGIDKGRQREILETLLKSTDENKARITDIKEKTHVQEIRIAEFLESVDTLKAKTDENKSNIADMRTKTHGLELRIAEFMGEMRSKFDYIKEAIGEIKATKGVKRATEK